MAQSGATDAVKTGMYIYDVTGPTRITSGTTVSNIVGTTLTLSGSASVQSGDTLIFSRGYTAAKMNGDSYVVAAVTMPAQNSTAGTVYFQSAVTIADATNGVAIRPNAHTIWLWEGTSGPPAQPPADIAFNRLGTVTLTSDGTNLLVSAPLSLQKNALYLAGPGTGSVAWDQTLDSGSGGMHVFTGMQVDDNIFTPRALVVGGVATLAGSATIGSFAFAALPAAIAGQITYVTDSTTNTWGANIAGGGTNKVLAFFDGSNWTVAGK
jgi:hypothetical protein